MSTLDNDSVDGILAFSETQIDTKPENKLYVACYARPSCHGQYCPIWMDDKKY